METIETTEKAAPILLDRLNGGRGIVRVGDTVTWKEQIRTGAEMTVKAIDSEWVYFRDQSGSESRTTANRLALTSSSELQARAQLGSVKEMVEALKAANDKLLTERAVGTAYGCDVDAQDTARDAIQADALSVEVRSGWVSPGAIERGNSNHEEVKAEEFKILLCTGGPAVQIVGTLDEHREPETARLEHQDWGTPWTEYRLTVEEQEAVLEYCRVFCFT